MGVVGIEHSCYSVKLGNLGGAIGCVYHVLETIWKHYLLVRIYRYMCR